MAAYVLVDIDITDPTRYAEYRKAVPATIEQFGGRFLVRGPEPIALEGDWPVHRIVILEFPTTEQAHAWWDSPEYAAVKKLRAGAADAKILLLSGPDS